MPLFLLARVKWYHIPGVMVLDEIYNLLRSHESHMSVSVSVKKHATLSSNENRYII